MQHKIFTVFDGKSEAYLQPFFLQTSGQAIRAFSDCVNDANHQFGRHPEDYTLFELGGYDDANSQFTIYETPVSLGKGIEVYKELSGLPLLEQMKKEAS